MLQFFHRYRKTFGGLMILSLAVLVLTGFGLDYYLRGQRTEVYAIRVGDKLVSHIEFEKARQQEITQYRRIFGEKVYEMMDKFKINLNQQLADRMVNEVLITTAAKKADLHVSDEEVQAFLIQQMPDRITRDDYARFLQQAGETPQSYEAKLREDLLRQQYTQLFEAASIPSRREIESRILLDTTKFGVDYVTFDPTTFVDKVPAPTDEELKQVYDRSQTELELPSRASYAYISITPEMVQAEIPLNADDLEVAYTDRAKEFTEPEQGKLQQILISVAKTADEKAKQDAHAKAELVLTKIKAGESFESLALQFSDDLTTKAKGGDLGWVKRGDLPQSVLDAAFALAPGKTSEILESAKGLHIIKLNEHKAERVKPLDEVKAQIEADLRRDEAPAFASDKAHTLYDKWTASKKSLKDFAAEQKLTVATTSGLLVPTTDPAGTPTGLTKSVVRTPDEKQQLVELGNTAVLVELNEYRDPEVPAIADVKEKLVEKFRKNQSIQLARTAAADLIKSAGSAKGVRAVATELKLKVDAAKDITRTSTPEAPFSDAELRQAVTNSAANQVGGRAYEVSGKYYVFQISSVTPPDSSEVAAKIASSRTEAAEGLSQVLVAANLRRMRKETDNIDIDAGVLSRE